MVEVEVTIEKVILVEVVFEEEQILLEEVIIGIDTEMMVDLGDNQGLGKDKELDPNQVHGSIQIQEPV